MLFLLKASQHIQPDTTAKPTLSKVIDPDTGGEVTVKKYPDKTFVAGDIIECEDDLVEKHGAAKFERVGDHTEGNARITALEKQIAELQAEANRLKAQSRIKPAAKESTTHKFVNPAPGDVSPPQIERHELSDAQARQELPEHHDKSPKTKSK